MSIRVEIENKAKELIQDTAWFRSCPADLRRTLTMEYLGIEKLPGSSLMGGEVWGDCLVAQVSMGGERRKFSWSLNWGTANEHHVEQS